ncbi:myosin-4 [Corythoichthys intestinalis]|uniref:myosin-4 n=1 Tax=Corythoichthys intestinalis TaxID=161448 RepID=UPI0025A5A5FB|nr:myosin-4 [Corythoichthys intestinalis]XP_057686014.1 myosin-4 [Corythoichthys intestinalis]XP_057686015.1 myosin-4 [Corythoichthys intestinalis]
MTAKHRKGKSNHKHEEDHVKSEIVESEVRTGGSSYTLVLFLGLLVVVVGGATSAWFCYQQHQTLTQLTDTVTGLQMKVVKLQASQETMRQTSDKVHISSDVESRLNALEASYTSAHKQVDEAFATALQLKTLDLPAQLLSLHTEMKSRLAEIQQTTVSAEQINQLEARLQGKAEELEGVGLLVERLTASGANLSKEVQTVMERLEEVESILGDAATLKEQTAQLIGLEVQLKSYQSEMATVRETLLKEQSEEFKQADVEEQISALQMSVQEQNSVSHSLHAQLKAQLDNLQLQVTQLIGDVEDASAPMQQAEGKPAPIVEEEVAVSDKELAEKSDSSQPLEEKSDEEAYTEQTETLSSPETVETHAKLSEGEEPDLGKIFSDEEFLGELLQDEGDAKPEEEYFDDNERIMAAEQGELEESEIGNEGEH